jgi:hypothetical protein
MASVKLFKQKFETPELQEKAQKIQDVISQFPPLDSEFLLSTYLYSIPSNIRKSEQKSYNTDLAIYAYQRALYENEDEAFIRAANHHYAYLSLLRFSQAQNEDTSYNALRSFAKQFAEKHPELSISTSERIKSLTSHTRKYCVNVMRGYHEGGGAFVDEQIDRIHDDKACRLILDMPRSANQLSTPDILLDAIFEAANTLPAHMERWRFKKMLANELKDSDSNINTRILPSLAPFYKNYVENPKGDTGYKSLHICFENLTSREELEYQIRSFEWHVFAEYGPAAHDDYKATQLEKVLTALQIDLLENLEYRMAFLQFMDMVNLDKRKIIVPNFYATDGYMLDRAGIFVPVTTEEEMFCADIKKKPALYMEQPGRFPSSIG